MHLCFVYFVKPLRPLCETLFTLRFWGRRKSKETAQRSCTGAQESSKNETLLLFQFIDYQAQMSLQGAK